MHICIQFIAQNVVISVGLPFLAILYVLHANFKKDVMSFSEIGTNII